MRKEWLVDFDEENIRGKATDAQKWRLISAEDYGKVHIRTPNGKYLFRANNRNSRAASIVIALVNLLLALNKRFPTGYELHLHTQLFQASSEA